jgi:phospholipid/cholesterol/gamma-HCH transport system permease protein
MEAFGKYVLFSYDATKRIFVPPVKSKLLVAQMEFIGVRSFVIMVLAAIMIGAVFAIQFGHIFKIFGAESMIGAAASFALSKELAPVVCGFLIAGRAGSAMTAEIATMKVNEQIDAMRVMAVNPISYLATPRILASVLMTPLLSGLFVLVGILSAFFIGTLLFDIDAGIFIEKIKWISKPKHITEGLFKAAVFGFVIGSFSCFKGFHASGGAKGVGQATTRSVVISLVTIIVSDFFLSYCIRSLSL